MKEMEMNIGMKEEEAYKFMRKYAKEVLKVFKNGK